jgi:hypothetical protein
MSRAFGRPLSLSVFHSIKLRRERLNKVAICLVLENFDGHNIGIYLLTSFTRRIRVFLISVGSPCMSPLEEDTDGGEGGGNDTSRNLKYSLLRICHAYRSSSMEDNFRPPGIQALDSITLGYLNSICI